MSQPQLQMPRACISCEHYSPVGHDDDKHCPFTNRWGETHGRTSYGQCDLHSQEVFATEICNSHEPEPFVHLVDVTNRPEPRTALNAAKWECSPNTRQTPTVMIFGVANAFLMMTMRASTMTFEEYETEYLSHLGPQARNLLRMGWNARGEHGNPQGILDGSGHEYSQGICADGAAILKDGQPMTIEEILAALRGSDHIPDATEMVKGAGALMGDVTDEDGTTYHKALVVQFATVEDFHAAMKAGQCRFTVFGGEA